MNYPCDKFGDCSFSRFGSVVWTNTHMQTDVDERFTPVIIIGVNKCIKNKKMVEIDETVM